MRRGFAAVLCVFGVASAVLRADDAPSAFSFDLRSAPNEFLGVKLLNAGLNRLSYGKQLMAVQAANVQNGLVALDLRSLFPEGQRRALAKLEPAPGQPIPLAAFLEALTSTGAPELDGIASKADLERIAEFSEAKDLPPAKWDPKKVKEDTIRWSEVRMAFRRLHPERTGPTASPPFEQWVFTAPNGMVRELFFAVDGKRLVALPAGAADGAERAIQRRLAELKRSRTGFGVSRPWYDLQDLAKRAERAANAASDEDIRRFLAEEKKRKAAATPTPIPESAAVAPAVSPSPAPAPPTP
jgi:hypothetical protein